MHKYIIRVHVLSEKDKSVNTFVLNDTVFTAVTIYQNEQVIFFKLRAMLVICVFYCDFYFDFKNR